MQTVTLKHGSFWPRKKLVYFYDGVLVAENGLLTIPANKSNWIARAFNQGYDRTPEGTRLSSHVALKDYIASLTAESAKGKNESSDSRRQPASEDRVRES